MNSTFTITYFLFGIIVLLGALVVAILAVPGPKKPSHPALSR